MEGEYSTKTDERGVYVFTNLPQTFAPVTYYVAEEMQDGWAQTFPGPQSRLAGQETRVINEGAALEFAITAATVTPNAITIAQCKTESIFNLPPAIGMLIDLYAGDHRA